MENVSIATQRGNFNPSVITGSAQLQWKKLVHATFNCINFHFVTTQGHHFV